MAMGLAPFADPTARIAFGLSDRGSKRAVACRAAGRDAAERGPDSVLEGRAVCFGREIGNGIEIAVKLSGNRMRCMRRPRGLAERHRARTVIAKQKVLHARFAVVPIDRAQPLRVIADETHPACRCFKMLDEKCLRGAHRFRSGDRYRLIVEANLALFGHLHPEALPATFMSENR
jgi:hypothetical protein